MEDILKKKNEDDDHDLTDKQLNASQEKAWATDDSWNDFSSNEGDVESEFFFFSHEHIVFIEKYFICLGVNQIISWC